jgi:vancomycin permeability regulator SanA
MGAVLVCLLVVAGSGFRVWQVARVDDRSPADVIVVLGAAQYNGEPSEVFQSRLAHAKSLYDDGVAEQIMTTGGKHDADVYTEAEAGERWLVAQGVPEEATIAVGEGADTLGSVEAAGDQMRALDLESAVLVSDPWHAQRALTMASDAGIDAWSSPTRSGPVVQTRDIQLRYIWRETKALLYYRVSKLPVDDVVGEGLG